MKFSKSKKLESKPCKGTFRKRDIFLRISNVLFRTTYDLPGYVGENRSAEVVPLLAGMSGHSCLSGRDDNAKEGNIPSVDGGLPKDVTKGKCPKHYERDSKSNALKSQVPVKAPKVYGNANPLKLVSDVKGSKLYAVYKRKSLRALVLCSLALETASKDDQKTLNYDFEEYHVSDFENDVETVLEKDIESSHISKAESVRRVLVTTLLDNKLNILTVAPIEGCEMVQSDSRTVGELEINLQIGTKGSGGTEKIGHSKRGTIRKSKRGTLRRSKEAIIKRPVVDNSIKILAKDRTSSTSAVVPNIGCGFVMNMTKYFESVNAMEF